MKKWITLLAIICVLLVFGLVVVYKRAGNIECQTRTQLTAASNYIATLETKLSHQERLNAVLDAKGRQLAEALETCSNRLVAAMADQHRGNETIRALQLRMEAAAEETRQWQIKTQELLKENESLKDLLRQANHQVQAITLKFQQLSEFHNRTVEALTANRPVITAVAASEGTASGKTNNTQGVSSTPESKASQKRPASRRYTTPAQPALELLPDETVRVITSSPGTGR